MKMDVMHKAINLVKRNLRAFPAARRIYAYWWNCRILSTLAPLYLRQRIAGDIKAIEVPGMPVFDLLHLYDWAQSMPANGIAVEVGSYLGSSSACIAAAIRHRNGHVYCVDTWQNDAMSEGARDTFSEFVRNTQPWQSWITPLRGRSTEVARSFERKIDFLFIDGDHSYDGCRQDIVAWFPKLRNGGICIFHDYPNAPGVVQNVQELLELKAITNECTESRLFFCKKACEIDQR